MMMPAPAMAQTHQRLKAAQGSATSVKNCEVTTRPESKKIQVLGQRSSANALPSLRKAMRVAAPLSRKAPAKVMGEAPMLPELCGMVTYQDGWSQSNAPAGLYKILNTGAVDELFLGPSAHGGVPVDGLYWTSTYSNFLGIMIIVNIDAYDMESGEQVATFTDYSDYSKIVFDFATDPATGTVYTLGYTEDASDFQLGKATFDETEGMSVTAIGTLPGNWNSIACGPDGQLYGINYTGVTEGEDYTVTSSTLYKIDKNTAALTEVGQTGMAPQYLSSSTIDPKTGVMYWTVNPPTEEGFLTTVNLTTGAATKILDFTLNDEIQGLFVAMPAAEEGAPAVVTDLSAEFEGGSLSGNINFSAPATTYDGTPATGALTYKILANDEEVATGSTEFGAAVSAPVTVPESGNYTFVITTENSVGSSPANKIKLFVGFGKPATPTATLTYEDGTMKLSWTAVTTSVDGGYLDPEAVVYTVTRFPGEVKVYEGSNTEFSETIAQPESLTKFYYTVVATADGVSSATATSNGINLGSGIVPPYINTFDTQADADGFTIIDANDDGKPWMWNAGVMRVSYNSSLDMDDWLITPPVKLQGGKLYTISFKAAAGSNSYNERVEAKWGTAATVAGMTRNLIEPTVLEGTTGLILSNMICPEADGTYYIGIHGISDRDKLYLAIDNLEISAPEAATIPDATADLTVTPDPTGALKATIAFTAPAKAMDGSALTELTKVELSRGNELIKTWEAPATGAALSYEDELETSGTYTYTVVAYNAIGQGASAAATAYVGVNKPAAPQNVEMAEEGNTGKVTITWDAVNTDVDGNPLNPAFVTYAIAEPSGNNWINIKDGLTTTSYTLQAVDADEQDFVQYAVFAVTNGGETGAVTDMIAVGKPYTSFSMTSEEDLDEYLLGVNTAGGAKWSIADNSKYSDVDDFDGTDMYLIMEGNYANQYASLFTGKIDLSAIENPGMTFYTMAIAETYENLLTVDVTDCATGEVTTVLNTTDYKSAMEWEKIMIDLAAFSQKTVTITLTGTIKTHKLVLIDAWKVGSLLGNDLEISDITAPATVNAGEDYSVDVTVSNEGVNNATDFTVTLYADGAKLAEETVEALASGVNTTVSFEATMSPIATEPVEFYAVVTYTADENTENNTSETIEVAPKQSKLPKVTDLAGESGAEGVELTWSEPDLANVAPDPVLVDVEDGEAWAEEYAGWTFVDVDGAVSGGFEGLDIPAVDPEGDKTTSFFVFDESGDEFSASFAAHSGHKYLASMFLYDGSQADDWAISPELSGDEQTISFWAKSYSAQYSETIEMYYSTGSIDPKDFVKVDGPIEHLPATWTEYSFEVPAGAKHFAVRSCAADAWMLMLDDFTFIPAGATSAELSIKGYDVYRDGEKINAELVEECEYTDTEATDGEHTYVVVTVYTTGSSAPSNAAVIEYDGIADATAAGIAITAGKGTITVTGAEGKLLTVAAADGKLYFNGAAAATQTIAAPAGIYVVKAGTKIAKVAVK